MSCRCRKIDCASVRGLTAHGYSLIARKPAVGVGATWGFAGTPPSRVASTHARVSGARVDVMSEGNNQLVVIKKACCVRARAKDGARNQETSKTDDHRSVASNSRNALSSSSDSTM